MLPEDEVQVESFRLAEGRVSLRLTHLPSGVIVSGDPDGVPYRDRLLQLHRELEERVQENKKV